MRQTVKNIVAVVAAITATATVIQVAKASLLPQALNKELQQSQPAGLIPVPVIAEPLQIRPEDSAAVAGPQQSDLLQRDDLTAFADMQYQTAFSSSSTEFGSALGVPFDSAKAANSLTELPHLASLEQSQPLEPSTPSRDLGLAPRRNESQEPSRGTNRTQPRVLPFSRIEFDTPTLAPVSHTVFCLKYRDECKIDQTVSTDSRVALTSERWAELERINAAVNRAIIPQPNTKGLAGEVWLISPRAGECHDYAVTKRHKLLALGWPAQDLLLSEVVTTWGEHHLVLVIRTNEGDFVADNLSANIRIWSRTPYQWVRIQSPGNPLIWSTLANATVAARARTRASGQADPS